MRAIVGIDDDFNLYAYVGNDPLNRADPAGTCGTGTKFTGMEAIGCKTYGIPQQTRGSSNHADAGAKRGEVWRKSGQYKEIHYNRSLRKATGVATASNRRADITGIRHNNTVDVHEDTSPSQTNAGQLAKGQSMLETLPASQRGTATAAPVAETLSKPIEVPVTRPTAIEPGVAPRVGPGVGLGGWIGIISVIEQAIFYAIDANQESSIDCSNANPGCA